ncbi:uncharacterized protein LOC129791308 [Lutzomyia longipalpis]|uniref:uncharacterized protein LOC129791308 n=1 Tax=Lutzomyia longipalpis TaxID=7200 RepID=UPI00248383C8|nr:uncharacterized protein LOC129791308 [Lutzomyia longipalpis]XP_055685379.1 uncharacterized protein LOC129791308 [Lutzomyia longipalpis]XP_055685380.1 uncharacterized protein LOC129791308 [Lutzomyia longipalpis]XP_055685381.1 uncharacterized protein LOC129791308 [Lutzomyia longipalpis]
MVIRQRGGIVSTITRIEGLVNGLTEAEVPLLGTREVLESQLRLVGQMRNKFLVLQTSIITDQTDETRKRTEVDYQKEILDRCDALTLNITSMLQQAPQDSAGESKSDLCNFMRDIMQQNQKCMMDLVNALSQNQSSGPSSGQAPSQNPPTVTKLPQIQLPTFDGKYNDWLSFRDRFQSSVIDHPSLSAVQKLDYLKSALTSDAASTIKHLSTTATNFSIAWDLLVQRFERKGEIVADHIRSLYSIPRVTSSDSQAIHKIYNTLSESVMALDAMEIPGRDPWIVQFVLDKLDTESKVLWGRECGNDVPSLSTFKKFLMQRCIDAKNSTESSATKNTNPNPKNQSYHKPNVSKRQIGVTQSDAAKPNCRCCSEAPHPLYRCAKFLGMSAFERFDVVKRLGLCRNCLDPHMTNSCTFRVCRKCQGKHNVLLHDKFASDSNSTVPPTPTTPPAPTTQNASGPPLQNSTSLVGVASTQRTRVYLMTAMVDALDVNGGRIPCRLLLDGGAEVNIITTELAQKLKLPRCQSNVAVVGVGGHQTKIRHQITATICSQISNDTFTFDCQVMPKATGNIPGWTTDKTQYNIPQHVTLADPLWADQKPIDIIVGGDVYWFSLLTNVISLGPGMPHLRETVFGYAIVGEQHSVPANRGAVCLATTSTLDDALEKFWKLEDLPDDAPITNEQQAAEDHFVATHTRTPEGRFVVELPFKKSPELLGESRPQAIRQLLALERKFEKFPELKKAYSEVMRDQLERGWLEPVPWDDSRAISYYMPHHGVFKDSTTTKLRIVYNGSAKTTSGFSLNDFLMVGPTVQDDLAIILLRFRIHAIAFTADITKMYLQLLMALKDADCTRLVWREDTNQPICDVRFLRVCFGLASSPFLATRALIQLAEEHEREFPLASKALKKWFYVDDCVVSCKSIEEAREIQSQLINVLGRGGFTLAKWTSNHKGLFEPNADSQDAPPENPIISVLGLPWNTETDSFVFTSPLDDTKEVKTKRNMASAIAKLFDPIGLIGPVVIEAKIMLQELHKLKIPWDGKLPQDIIEKWLKFAQGLQHLPELKIPRWISCFECPVTTELHIFCDASINAYGVAIYIVTSDAKNNKHSSLYLAKSRVAPLQKLTIPKLELEAAKVAICTYDKFKNTCNADSTYFWSDSTTVLSWLRSPPDDFKVFVANRVRRILQSSEPDQWHHVPGKCNPADIISRGASPAKLRDCDLWWKGPEWLVASKTSWPEPFMDFPTTIEEAKCHVVAQDPPLFSDLFVKFSSLSKIQRIVAYCLKFCQHSREPITAVDMENALHTLIKIDQQTYWPGLAEELKDESQLSSEFKSISNLAPFLDSKGLIRVGGRLEYSSEPFSAKHPILLPKSLLTLLIARREHLQQLHAPPTLLLASLRQYVWPIGGRNLVRKVVHECGRCYRFKPRPLEQIMANLPGNRVELYRPFQSVGVDFAGPIQMLSSATRGVRSRKAGTQKIYIAVYVCMATKAAHLEIVTSLSTEAFLASFRCFTARRTTPRHVFSDCGKNFTGAANELSRLLQQEEAQRDIVSATREHGILWHFNPPASPHHGGLWEACVKSTKYHLIRVTNSKPISYEELHIVLCQIENVLNSRPICKMSEDPNDRNFLTPGHFFLLGAPNAPPDPNLTHIPENRLSYWEACQHKVQEFGRKWRLFYLNTLQQRSRWRNVRDDLVVGEVVLLLDEGNPEGCKWVLGLIEKVRPRRDGHVRVVEVRTKRGVYTRPITKVARLPATDLRNSGLPPAVQWQFSYLSACEFDRFPS